MSYTIYPDDWELSLKIKTYFHEQWPSLDEEYAKNDLDYQKDSTGYYTWEHLAPCPQFLRSWFPYLSKINREYVLQDYCINIPADKIEDLKLLMDLHPETRINLEEVYLWCKSLNKGAYIV